MGKSGKTSPKLILVASHGQQCGNPPTSDVGSEADAALEERIRSCGKLMEQAYQRYAEDGFIADIGEAHGHRLRMQALISQRSPAQVARMERERGLD